MNEEMLNTSVRKVLKKVGVTSQREIEEAVRAAASSLVSKWASPSNSGGSRLSTGAVLAI
jgi:hypothetical protein